MAPARPRRGRQPKARAPRPAAGSSAVDSVWAARSKRWPSRPSIPGSGPRLPVNW